MSNNIVRDVMIDLAEYHKMYHLCDNLNPKSRKPGEAYMQTGKIRREILKGLKSEDISDIRIN